jgi:hypothetical protein
VEEEMARKGSRHGKMRSTYIIFVQKLEGKRPESIDVHRRTILKRILKKLYGCGLSSSGSCQGPLTLEK